MALTAQETARLWGAGSQGLRGEDPRHPRQTRGSPARHIFVTNHRTAAGDGEDDDRPNHEWRDPGLTAALKPQGLCSIELLPSLIQENRSPFFPQLPLRLATVKKRSSTW